MKNVKCKVCYGAFDKKLMDEMPELPLYAAVHVLDPLRGCVRVKEFVWESLGGES